MVSTTWGRFRRHLGHASAAKVNVARNVQDVCFERAGLPDDVPSVQPAFTELRCFNPTGFGDLSAMHWPPPETTAQC